MTAAALSKFYPEKQLTVIEDPNTPTVGVGESTYDGFIYFCKILEINECDFFKFTDASLKLGLKFIGFNGSSDDVFTYMFGTPDTSDTRWGVEDWQIRKQLYPHIPLTDYTESFFPQAFLAKHNRYSDNLDGSLGTFNPDLDRALHFDAVKFAEWLKKSYCEPRGVTYASGTVTSCNFDDNGYISELVTSEGIVKADLFIDCTGFKSLLLGQFLGEPFKSYNNVLPNNRAWATQVPYVDKDKELTAYTTCTALGNGWCWDIPLWSRLGAGYVYSDEYASPNDALKEFKEYLVKGLTVPRSEELVESLQFHDIPMRVGIHERVWVNNVVAIGLSAGFIEPLESNGLFTVHEFLYQLIKSLENGPVSNTDIHIFNDYTRTTYDHFIEFIKLHYCFSKRHDTSYWIANMSRDYQIGSAKTNIRRVVDAWSRDVPTHPNDAANWISGGFGYRALNSVSILQGQIRHGLDYKEYLNSVFSLLDNKKELWNEAALLSPTLSDYIQERYHSECG